MSDAVPEVRFDGLDPWRARRSFRMCGLRRVVEARRAAEVMPAIREIERAVAGGLEAAGMIAYEAAPAFEPRLAVRVPSDLPLLWFGLYEAREEVEPLSQVAGDFEVRGLEPTVSEWEHRRDIERILEWIKAGDTYQVNHTFRLRGAFRGSDEALYRHVCATQRAAYCALLRLPRFTIVSASPELFVHRRGDALELRPMKGTRPRGRWTAEDEALAAELAASEKERAENLMIVDLVRNDAGRIARFGSVHVPELYRVERYPTVHQLTSTVVAQLRAGTTLEDTLRALFPSGSVTGAPKIRTTEIIAELETTPRGVYTGAIGFVSAGEAMFNVAIRTAVVDRERGVLELGVGSGITADSDAAAEWRESLQKAAFLTADARPFRVLTSLRYEAGRGVFLRDAHMRRLEDAAAYFGFPLERVHVEAALDRATAPLGAGVHKVRILVDEGGGIDVESEMIAGQSPPVRLVLAREPIDERDRFLYHKTTRREVYVARLAAHAGCDDVALVNRRGELAGATTGNIVLRLDGACWTPPIDAGVLAGTYRAYLLARGDIRERRLTPADYHAAEAAFVINSVRLRREAVRLDREGPSR